jgi:3-oxoacyl-(acyl-carrier-protein) synthase
MMAQLSRTVRISDMPASIDAAYAAEVDWSQGYRLNPDARLALVGAGRLLQGTANEDAERDRTAVVLGSDFGSLCSYETFYDGLARGKAQPLPYTHALPSTPTAALSIYLGLHAPTLTVSGEAEVGVSAVRVAQLLLASDRCNKVIVGCWHTPSATTAQAGLSERAQLLLLLLERAENGGGRLGFGDLAVWSGSRDGRTCVDVLGEWLAANEKKFEAPVRIEAPLSTAR